MINIILGLLSMVIGTALLVEGMKLMFMSNGEKAITLDKLNKDHQRLLNERRFVREFHELARIKN